MQLVAEPHCVFCRRSSQTVAQAARLLFALRYNHPHLVLRENAGIIGTIPGLRGIYKGPIEVTKEL
jgi:hypothetical protein